MNRIMRKIARTLCLVLALALCLAACGGGPEKQDDEPAATLYERLGAMAAADYPSVTLTVRTAMGGEELNAVYRLTRAADGATSIDFSYEALAEYDLADPAPLAGRIETKSGSVGFDRSGAVVSSTGAALNIGAGALSFSGFSFRADCGVSERTEPAVSLLRPQ